MGTSVEENSTRSLPLEWYQWLRENRPGFHAIGYISYADRPYHDLPYQ